MYQVDTGIGVNGLVQSLDILSECGHYDHDLFPWHAMMIDKLSEDLNELACSLSVNKKIDLIIGLSRIPVRPVIDLVNDLLKTVTNEEFATRVTMYLDDEYCEKIANYGPKYLTEEDETSGMLCHYLHKSTVPVTGDNIRKEVSSITKTVLKESSSNSLMRVTFVGMLKIEATLFKLPSKENFNETGKTDIFEWYFINSDAIPFVGGKLYITCSSETTSPSIPLIIAIRCECDDSTVSIDAEWKMKVMQGDQTLLAIHAKEFFQSGGELLWGHAAMIKEVDERDVQIRLLISKWIVTKKEIDLEIPGYSFPN